MASCDISVMKSIFCMFNVIFGIFGIFIIGAGSLVFSNVGKLSYFLESRILVPPVILIVAGMIIFVVAFFGCYGTFKQNYNMIMAFTVVLLMIFVSELAVGLTAAVFRNDFKMFLKGSMTESMINYSEADRIAWENMQQKLQCCGISSHSDWYNIMKADYAQTKLVPRSCCKKVGRSKKCNPEEIQDLYLIGCYKALEEKVRESATILIGAGISIALVEVVGIIFACRLALFIKKEDLNPTYNKPLG